MNFSSMEYFIAVAQERSFTKAAEQLHITQQSLSSHIAGMEKELDCQLLVRNVPLKLTYAGEVLLRYAKRFSNDWTMLQQEFSDISQNQKGILRVGISMTRGRTLLPEIILSFQESYPNICVEMVEDTNEGLNQKLLKGEIDLAVANFPDSMPGITLWDYYQEEVVLLISRSQFREIYGDRAEECREMIRNEDFSFLKELPFVLGHITDIGGRVGRAFLRRAGIMQPTIKALSDNAETLLSLCVQGAGACFCAENLARATLSSEQMDSLLLFRLGPNAQYRIRFGYIKQSYQWSAVEAFMDEAIRHRTGTSQ